MEDSNLGREKRKYPRFYLSLPIEFRVVNDEYLRGAMIVNASETGLLVQYPKNIPVGSRLNIAVIFSKGFELANFEVSAEVVWAKVHPYEDREGYQFGLRFIDLSEENREKLKLLFGDAY